MQVSVHKIVYKVDILEGLLGAAKGRHNIYQVHNVVVLKLPKQRDFSESTSSINVVVERVLDLLDGYLLLVVVVVLCRTNNAVCAFPDSLDGL
jgi:hypothetical protein